MVEYNSNGLVQFFQIMKKAYLYIITQGKELIIWAYHSIKDKFQ